MLIGHFAVGLVAKRIEPQVSAGTMVLAAMFTDLLWCELMLAGLEQVQFKPGIGAGNARPNITVLVVASCKRRQAP